MPTILHATIENRSQGILVTDKHMATATKQRRGATNPPKRRNGSKSPVAVEFPAGSLEAGLSAIGNAAPARDWAKVPSDYFASLDHYLHGAPKRK
jgi:hypothetical protein